MCIKQLRFKNPKYLALFFPRSNQLFPSTPFRSYLHCNFWSEALGHAPPQYLRSFSKRKVTTTLIPAGYLHIAKTISGDIFLICCVPSHSSSGTELLCSHCPSSTTAAVPNRLPEAFLPIQSSNWETSYSTCIPPSHTDLNKLLGVLVKFLQDGKGLLRKTVLEDPLDYTTAIWMCRQCKNLHSTKTDKHRQQHIC